MLYHLFMAGRRKRGEEGEEVTVTFEHILRFTTAAETESLLGFQIDPSIIFVESFCGSIFVGKFLPRKQFMHKPASFTKGREFVQATK